MLLFELELTKKGHRQKPMSPQSTAAPLGTPGAIRTRDLPLRRRMLYPAELRKQINSLIILAQIYLYVNKYLA